jgi:anti-sigma regulatory factor (Ser/Thr protein kinase)
MARRFAATYEASPQSVKLVRNQMAALAADCGLSEARIADVRLAVSEAATNALVHAYEGGEPGVIRVEAEIADGELRITVRDDGRGITPRTDSPGLGLGLPIIASVTKRLEFSDDQAAGTGLRMAFCCPRADLAGA